MPEPETYFDTVRQKAAATAMGNTADTEGGAGTMGRPESPGETSVIGAPDSPWPGRPAPTHEDLQRTRLNPGGHMAKLFEQAGINIAEAELEAMLRLPDDQFAEALRTLPQSQKPEIDLPTGRHSTPAPPGRRLPPVGSPEYGMAFAEKIQRREDAAGAPPQGFTVDPQDPTIFVTPDGRRFRALE